MKFHSILIAVGVLTVCLSSCDPVTGSDSYDSAWSPSGDPDRTPWKFPAGVSFVQEDGGFQFSANVNDSMVVKGAKDSSVSYTFTPQIYQLTNITSASSASVSFKASITSSTDSVAVLPSGKVFQQFGKVGGTLSASGDSVHFAVKPFLPDVQNTLDFSVNPDSCSKMLRFTVTLRWNNFTGNRDTSVAIPRTKKLTVEVSEVFMRVSNLSVLK